MRLTHGSGAHAAFSTQQSNIHPAPAAVPAVSSRWHLRPLSFPYRISQSPGQTRASCCLRLSWEQLSSILRAQAFLEHCVHPMCPSGAQSYTFVDAVRRRLLSGTGTCDPRQSSVELKRLVQNAHTDTHVASPELSKMIALRQTNSSGLSLSKRKREAVASSMSKISAMPSTQSPSFLESRVQGKHGGMFLFLSFLLYRKIRKKQKRIQPAMLLTAARQTCGGLNRRNAPFVGEVTEAQITSGG